MLPLLISIALRIAPRILLDKNDLSVRSGSTESVITSQSILSTACINPIDPSCIRSLILNTPDACCVVENLRARFYTRGRNLTISSSRL